MHPSPPAIATVELTKQFDDTLAVNAVNLQVGAGEIYGLIGPNGAGKTTLIRMLAAAEDPTAGEIYITGQRFVRGQANPEVKRHIGFLPDDFPLYDDLTVQDYLDYFGQLYYLPRASLKPRIEEVLALVSMESKRHSAIGTLSRGMRQRLSLARCILHHPTLLLLDEPVSGLDPIARVEFRNIIKGLHREGMTILISSHILSDLAEFCTSVGIMERGRMVESTPLQDLYARSGQQQIVIGCLGDRLALENCLRDRAYITGWEPIPGENKLRVGFNGSLEDAADLLRSLIEAGIAVTEFHRAQETLEAIFFKLGHRETS